MGTVRFTIDGHEVTAEAGEMLFDVAKNYGIDIPSLCHHPALAPYSACRMCIVEVTRGGRTRVTASCSYPVSDGIEVRTDSEDIKRLRRITIESLMAEAPDAKEIREMAEKLGVIETRFKPNEDTKNRCILCGLCVRICGERMGVFALGYEGRGARRRINTPFGKLSDVCITCGTCISVCPTDAIRLETISKNEPIPLVSEFDMDLSPRHAAYIPFPQAVPLKYVIDPAHCMSIARDKCGACAETCGPGAIDYSQKEEEIELDVSSVLVVPGFDQIDPETRSEYGYSTYKNVVTALEFERILSASGPFSGHIRRISDGVEPEKIAFIQCVGSRDRNRGMSYCSAVCCMYAIKEAIIAKEHSPGLDVTIFHMDIRAFGKEFDYYYERAQNMGIRFVRCRVADIRESEKKDLTVNFVDEKEGLSHETFDMVVLSNGIAPPDEAEKLGEALGIKLDSHGFCETSTFHPLETGRPGVFVAGAFSEPKDIPDTVAQASGAVAKASAMISSEGLRLTHGEEFPKERDVTEEEPRIGVFVCHCGINIGKTVNVPDVVEYAKTLKDVAYVEENLYTCSQDTQELIKEKIIEHKLNRVVVASCSPRTHEPLFQNTVRGAELNPYLFEMANIRDQCSWVHMNEPQLATEKAKDLVRMAVANARLLRPLYKSKLPVTKTGLIIGGGLSGITAALELAAQGYEAHLVEREPVLGGNLRNLRFTIQGEDVKEQMEELISAVEGSHKIHVYKQAEVADIEGHIGDFKVKINMGGENLGVNVGAVIVATGGEEYKPKEYLYGEHEKVMTQMEFEQKLAEGVIKPNNVLMIQCVGSRNEERPYCSRVCCTHAVKNALKVKETNPDSEINVLFKDIRTYGFREDYYFKASEAGVEFFRYDDENKPVAETAEDGGLRVTLTDPVLGDQLVFKPDILVLSAAILPQPDNEKLSKLLKAQLSRDGFFLEAHMKLRPVDFSTEGMFLCGLAHSPKFINESISQAAGTVARACTILSKDYLEVGGAVSEVETVKCTACLTCVHVCPYNVPEVGESGAAVIDVAECQGCGICAAECPTKAIQLRHYTDKQLMAKCEALFKEGA